MPTFTCSACGKPVLVLEDGSKVKKCDHKDAPIHANLTATLYSKGGVAAK